MVNPHLTDEQIKGYRNRSLGPVELLDVDDHISVCEICRDRIAQDASVSSGLRSLRAELTAHLQYEELVDCAEGKSSPESEQHIADCEMCRLEVSDLRQFRAEIGSRKGRVVIIRHWWIPAAIAAALALMAGASQWYARPTHTVQLIPVRVALERAPILDQLIRHRGELLGLPEARKFELTAPVGTAVLSDLPEFRWKPLRGASSYRVAIFDENFNKVFEGEAITGTSLVVSRPLPRGRVYIWQVTARVSGRAIHAPQPPDPEARFQVVSEPVLAGIENARRSHPGDHLLLAELYAKAGALDDAEREISLLAASLPAEAAILRADLAKIREH